MIPKDIKKCINPGALYLFLIDIFRY